MTLSVSTTSPNSLTVKLTMIKKKKKKIAAIPRCYISKYMSHSLFNFLIHCFENKQICIITALQLHLADNRNLELHEYHKIGQRFPSINSYTNSAWSEFIFDNQTIYQ